jgi:hypothetical protein
MSWKADRTPASPPYNTWPGRFGPRADLFLLRNKDASFEAKFEARNRLRAELCKNNPNLVKKLDEYMTADDVDAMTIADGILMALRLQ